MTGAYAQDNKLTPGPGEVELTYVGKNTQLGIWNPQTRVYTQTSVYADGPLAGQHHQMTFNENGEVINREGLLLGFKKEDGSWKAGKIENVLNSSYMVLWNMEVIGNIIDNIVTIHGVPMVSTSAPMDTDVLTFIVFCNHWGPAQINHIKETVEKEKERQVAEARKRQQEEAAKNPQSTKKVGFNKSSCSFTTMKGKTFNLYGKVKLVEYDHQADIKVLLVEHDHQAGLR